MSTTTLRGKKTIYAKPCDELEAFGWLGKCSRMSGVEVPKGDINVTYCQGDLTGTYQIDQKFRSAPGPTTSTLMIKETIRNALYDTLQHCPQDLDIRTILCGRRDDPLNWEMIKRLCCVDVTSLSTDDESSFSFDDEGETIISGPVATRVEPVIIYRNIVGQRVEEVDLTSYYLSRISKCHGDLCADECDQKKDCKLVATAVADAPSNPPPYAKSTDGGRTWTVSTIAVFTTATTLTDISCVGDLIIAVASGEPGYAYSWDDGMTWSLVDDTVVPAFATSAPLVVEIFSPTLVLFGGENGYLWLSDDGGVTVTAVDEGVVTISDIIRIKFADANVVYATGEDNTMKKSVNGGSAWEAVTLPVAQAAFDVAGLLVVTDAIVLVGYSNAGGAGGGVFYTTDGGATWTRDASIPTNYHVTSFVMCGCGVVFLSGATNANVGFVYRNVDYGAPARWVVVSIDDPGTYYYDIECCGPNHAIAVGGPSGVYGAGVVTLIE